MPRWSLAPVLLAVVWWLLAGDDPRSWLIGVPVVLAAAVAAAALAPRRRSPFSVRGLARFVPYFVWRSMAGSVDVAWRALHPGLPISPALVTYSLRLPPEGPARPFFAAVLNLLPGTLSAELDDRSVTIHLLNAEAEARLADLRRLELRVGAMFGLRLLPGPSGESSHD